MSERINGYNPENTTVLPFPPDFKPHVAVYSIPAIPEAKELRSYSNFISRVKQATDLSSAYLSKSLTSLYPKRRILTLHPIIPFLEIPFAVAVNVSENSPKKELSDKNPNLQENIVHTLTGLLHCMQQIQKMDLEWLGPFGDAPHQATSFTMPFTDTDELLKIIKKSKTSGKQKQYSFAIQYFTKHLGKARSAEEPQNTLSAVIRCDPNGEDQLEVDIEVIEHTWNHDAKGRLAIIKGGHRRNLIDEYFGKNRHHIPFLQGTPASIKEAQQMIISSLGLDNLFQFDSTNAYPEIKKEKALFQFKSERRAAMLPPKQDLEEFLSDFRLFLDRDKIKP